VINEPDYDCGLINDYGGGDVSWWQDYIRAEIGRANEHWAEIVATKDAEITRFTQENERMREALKKIAKLCPEGSQNISPGDAASHIARAALTIPDPAGGMPVEVE
jgi:hypothetical protein